MEYVLIHRGKRGQSYEYELLYHGEGEAGHLFMMGLIDIKKLQCDANKEPLKQNKESSSRAQVEAKSPLSSSGKNNDKAINTVLNENAMKETQKTTSYKNNNASHPTAVLAASPAEVTQ